ALLVADQTPLDEQGLTLADPEQASILGRRGFSAERRASRGGHHTACRERLEQRRSLEVAAQQRLDALRGEDCGLKRDRLVVGDAHATQDDDAVDTEALALLVARIARVLLHGARARHAAAAAHLVAEGEDVGRR